MTASLAVNTETPWPPVGWITKPEAAKRLNLSESRAAALAGEGKPIKSTISKNPNSRKGQNVTLFHEGDVEAYVFRRDHPDENLPGKLDRLLSLSDKPSLVMTLDRERHNAAASMGFSLTAEEKRLARIIEDGIIAPISLKPWITLDEAAEISGLPKSILLTLIGERKLKCIDVGPRAGGSYRVRRADIETLEGEFLS